MLKAKAFGLASLLFCGSIGGLAGEKQTGPADFAPFTVEVTRGGPIGVCPLTNPPMDKGVKFIVKPKEGEGYFKKGKGKILSSKSHGKNVWVAIEDSSASFVAALKSLDTDKSTLVLCGGEWANSGNGGNGNSINKPDNWLAELSGQEELRLFICHLYPTKNNNTLSIAIMREFTRYYKSENVICLKVGEGYGLDGIPCIGTTENIGNGGNIRNFLAKQEQIKKHHRKISVVYSYGHGADSGLIWAGNCGISVDDKKTIAWLKLNNHQLILNDDNDPDKGYLRTNQCHFSQYIDCFRDFLEGKSYVYLYHCYSGTKVSELNDESFVSMAKLSLKGINSTIIGVDGKMTTYVETDSDHDEDELDVTDFQINIANALRPDNDATFVVE